jgi:hypothetical protein
LLQSVRRLDVAVAERRVTIRMSIGVADNRESGVADVEALTGRAQAGLARARAAGGGRWERAALGSTEAEELRREVDGLRAELARREADRRPAGADREIETLRRRIAKLNRTLESTQERLERVLVLQAEGDGIASMYDRVQGLSLDAPNAVARLAMLAKIFESNLALREAIGLRRPKPQRAGKQAAHAAGPC